MGRLRGLSLDWKCRILGLVLLAVAVLPALQLAPVAGDGDWLGPSSPVDADALVGMGAGPWLLLMSLQETAIVDADGRIVDRLPTPDGSLVAASHVAPDGRVLRRDSIWSPEGRLPLPGADEMGQAVPVALSGGAVWFAHDGKVVRWTGQGADPVDLDGFVPVAAGTSSIVVAREEGADGPAREIWGDDGTRRPLPAPPSHTMVNAAVPPLHTAWSQGYVGIGPDGRSVLAWDENGEQKWRHDLPDGSWTITATASGWVALESAGRSGVDFVWGTPDGRIQERGTVHSEHFFMPWVAVLPAGDGLLQVEAGEARLVQPSGRVPYLALWGSLTGFAAALGVVTAAAGPRVVRARAQGGMSRCLHCGSRRQEGIAFCMDCGWRTDDEERSATSKKAPWEHEW